MEYFVYLDDSGHPSDQPYVVVAGFLASEYQWLAFEPEWKDALRRHNLRDPFHMTDFESAKRTRHQIKEKGKILGALIEVINARTEANFSVVVDMNDYRKVNNLYALEESIGTPYSIAARSIAMFLNRWKRKHFKHDDHLQIFVEDGTKHKGDMEEAFRRDALPLPRYVPKAMAAVQPADLLAWEAFHYVRYDDDRRSLVNLLKNRSSFDGIFHEKNLIETCKNGRAPLRSELAANAEIVFHSLPKRKRRRTIK